MRELIYVKNSEQKVVILGTEVPDQLDVDSSGKGSIILRYDYSTHLYSYFYEPSKDDVTNVVLVFTNKRIIIDIIKIDIYKDVIPFTFMTTGGVMVVKKTKKIGGILSFQIFDKNQKPLGEKIELKGKFPTNIPLPNTAYEVVFSFASKIAYPNSNVKC